VRLYAERVGVADAESALTYRNLNAVANRIAHAVLARRGAGPEPVALMVGNGVQVAAAMLGVLKAGKFYVSLDVSQPQARTATILADCRPALLIVDNERLEQAERMCDGLDPPVIPLLNLDTLEAGLSEENPGLPIASDALAYVVYTSGSTGKPEGAVQDHRYVLHLTNPRSEVAVGSPAPRLMP
jgi:non-ribosomal peptide synthetase component F